MAGLRVGGRIMRYYKVKFLEKPRCTKTELDKLMGTKVPVYDAKQAKLKNNGREYKGIE